MLIPLTLENSDAFEAGLSLLASSYSSYRVSFGGLRQRKSHHGASKVCGRAPPRPNRLQKR